MLPTPIIGPGYLLLLKCSMYTYLLIPLSIQIGFNQYPPGIGIPMKGNCNLTI